ncbi:hypothetical protein CI238_13068, partial [Colletotrichum incanum]
LLLKGLPA